MERRKDDIDFDFSGFKNCCLNGNKNKAFDNNELLKLLKELKKDLTIIVHDQKSALNPEERF
jgi:hypothetical protein